ncbi:hypothetical protein A3Q56_07954, partial [Intoshia linei]
MGKNNSINAKGKVFNFVEPLNLAYFEGDSGNVSNELSRNFSDKVIHYFEKLKCKKNGKNEDTISTKINPTHSTPKPVQILNLTLKQAKKEDSSSPINSINSIPLKTSIQNGNGKNFKNKLENVKIPNKIVKSKCEPGNVKIPNKMVKSKSGKNKLENVKIPNKMFKSKNETKNEKNKSRNNQNKKSNKTKKMFDKTRSIKSKKNFKILTRKKITLKKCKNYINEIKLKKHLTSFDSFASTSFYCKRLNMLNITSKKIINPQKRKCTNFNILNILRKERCIEIAKKEQIRRFTILSSIKNRIDSCVKRNYVYKSTICKQIFHNLFKWKKNVQNLFDNIDCPMVGNDILHPVDSSILCKDEYESKVRFNWRQDSNHVRKNIDLSENFQSDSDSDSNLDVGREVQSPKLVKENVNESIIEDGKVDDFSQINLENLPNYCNNPPPDSLFNLKLKIGYIASVPQKFIEKLASFPGMRQLGEKLNKAKIEKFSLSHLSHINKKVVGNLINLSKYNYDGILRIKWAHNFSLPMHDYCENFEDYQKYVNISNERYKPYRKRKYESNCETTAFKINKMRKMSLIKIESEESERDDTTTLVDEKISPNNDNINTNTACYDSTYLNQPDNFRRNLISKRIHSNKFTSGLNFPCFYFLNVHNYFDSTYTGFIRNSNKSKKPDLSLNKSLSQDTDELNLHRKTVYPNSILIHYDLAYSTVLKHPSRYKYCFQGRWNSDIYDLTQNIKMSDFEEKFNKILNFTDSDERVFLDLIEKNVISLDNHKEGLYIFILSLAECKYNPKAIASYFKRLDIKTKHLESFNRRYLDMIDKYKCYIKEKMNQLWLDSENCSRCSIYPHKKYIKKNDRFSFILSPHYVNTGKDTTGD